MISKWVGMMNEMFKLQGTDTQKIVGLSGNINVEKVGMLKPFYNFLFHS